MPAEIISRTPINVLKFGISLNNKYPVIIDHIIKEYSKSEIADGEAMW